MATTTVQVGRVIRVGRGWADVAIDRKLRRVSTRSDLLVRAGSYLCIQNDKGFALMPANERQTIKKLQ